MGTIAQIFLGRFKDCKLCKSSHEIYQTWIWGDKEHVKFYGDDVGGERVLNIEAKRINEARDALKYIKETVEYSDIQWRIRMIERLFNAFVTYWIQGERKSGTKSKRHVKG